MLHGYILRLVYLSRLLLSILGVVLRYVIKERNSHDLYTLFSSMEQGILSRIYIWHDKLFDIEPCCLLLSSMQLHSCVQLFIAV
jgi:hypothetical protein